MVTVPAGGQFPTGEKGGLFRLSESARTSPEPSVTIVAVGPEPEKSAISGSKPPGEMTDPAALVPPPNPHVWKVRVSRVVSVKVASTTLWGVLKAPVYERDQTGLALAVADSRKTAERSNRHCKAPTKGRIHSMLSSTPFNPLRLIKFDSRVVE